MSGFTWFWVLWVSVGVIVEGIALWGKRHPYDTLSQNVQWLVLGSPAKRHATLAIWAAFAVWFGLHIWT